MVQSHSLGPALGNPAKGEQDGPPGEFGRREHWDVPYKDSPRKVDTEVDKTTTKVSVTGTFVPPVHHQPNMAGIHEQGGPEQFARVIAPEYYGG